MQNPTYVCLLGQCQASSLKKNEVSITQLYAKHPLYYPFLSLDWRQWIYCTCRHWHVGRINWKFPEQKKPRVLFFSYNTSNARRFELQFLCPHVQSKRSPWTSSTTVWNTFNSQNGLENQLWNCTRTTLFQHGTQAPIMNRHRDWTLNYMWPCDMYSGLKLTKKNLWPLFGRLWVALEHFNFSFEIYLPAVRVFSFASCSLISFTCWFLMLSIHVPLTGSLEVLRPLTLWPVARITSFFVCQIVVYLILHASTSMYVCHIYIRNSLWMFGFPLPCVFFLLDSAGAGPRCKQLPIITHLELVENCFELDSYLTNSQDQTIHANVSRDYGQPTPPLSPAAGRKAAGLQSEMVECCDFFLIFSK